MNSNFRLIFKVDLQQRTEETDKFGALSREMDKGNVVIEVSLLLLGLQLLCTNYNYQKHGMDSARIQVQIQGWGIPLYTIFL